jgi:WD40 repeat protein
LGYKPPTCSLLYAAAFLLDGEQLASASGDKTIKLWDMATGTALHKLDGRSGFAYAIAFSPNGKQLASASSDKTIKLSAAGGSARDARESHGLGPRCSLLTGWQAAGVDIERLDGPAVVRNH